MKGDSLQQVGETTPSTPWRGRALLLVALAVATLLRIAGAWDKELWLDELHSALIASRPLSEWLWPGKLGGYTPLYFLISLPFSRLGGDFMARIPSIVFGISTVYAAWRYASLKTPGRLLFPTLAALLIAVNPSLIVFSSYHRMYALYTFCLAMMLTRADSPRNGRLAFWALSAFLAFPNAAFYVAAFFMIGLFVPSRRRAIIIALGGVILLGVLFALPGLLTLQKESAAGDVARFPALDLHLFLRFPKFLLGGPFSPASPLRPLAAPLAVVGWLTLAWGGLRAIRGDRTCRDLVILTLLPPLLEALLQPLGIKIYQDKSYLPGAYFISLLLAYLIAGIRPSFARASGIVAVAITLAAMLKIDAAWIDGSQPFSMKERRDHVQVPLHQTAAAPIPSVDENGIRPLVLDTPTFLLGALRYNASKSRPLYAPEERIASFSTSGPYHELVLNAVRSAGIRVVPEQELPKAALWMTTAGAVAGRTVATAPSGFVLIAVDDTIDPISP